MNSLTAFHFLRPEVFWLVIPVVLILIVLQRRGSVEAKWRGVIAPHLLEHLIVRPQRRWRLRPIHLLGLALVVAVCAAAGPTWRQEQSPLTQDTAPLVIALDLSDTMLVEDVQPSRLERAKQKIIDILETRAGAKTALVVYAGSAHLVLPLTDDPGVLETYVEDLGPSIMPKPGSDPAAALAAAEAMLADEKAPGTIVFVTSGVGVASVPAFRSHEDAFRDQVLVLAVATTAGGPIPGTKNFSSLDREGLEALTSATGVRVVGVTPDTEDVETISRRIAAHLTAVQNDDNEGRWRDDGWLLVWPLAVITVLWFRRGWLVQWEE
ncbi:MAG: VWA domain-containing protein [Acidobacteriota bacterium]